ncbi:hypothetical protein FB451DRAFT_1412318 [Mycena latifolia]|nr:hypothetical protein FB451DRAFT_1412318 [Mycena latifolia]
MAFADRINKMAYLGRLGNEVVLHDSHLRRKHVVSTVAQGFCCRALSTEALAAFVKRGLMIWRVPPLRRLCGGRREGHLRKDCKEPTICVACGVEGHQRKHCPSPDPARLEALKIAPVKCFRCGENHTLKEYPQPPKCFECGQPGHGRKDCPAFTAKLAAAKAAKAGAQPIAA